MVWPVPPHSQTDAVGRVSMGNMKVFEASIFVLVAFLCVCVCSISMYTTDSKGSAVFSEVAVHMHVNIVRLECNLYSKVKEWIDP